MINSKASAHIENLKKDGVQSRLPLGMMGMLLFIGPESDHWECLSVTDSLTD